MFSSIIKFLLIEVKKVGEGDKIKRYEEKFVFLYKMMLVFFNLKQGNIVIKVIYIIIF